MLKKIAESIKQNQNIIEKKDINPIIKFIEKHSYKNNRIFSSVGEDSAALHESGENSKFFILVTTDRIRTSYIEIFPFGAGFSSILVGVDDIYCCGGIPLAASIILSYKEEGVGQKIIEGICEGSNKFRVPVIRGHTNPNGQYYELSSTMVGEIKKENYVSAKNAQVGDNIILAVDFDGKIAKASKMYWDTVTFKTSETVLRKRESMKAIAENHLANSSKDISNGGIFGTILQLIKYSNVGANINVNDIKIPKRLIEQEYSLDKYIQMYLTTSYVLTANDKKTKHLLEIFEDFGLTANIIGKIIKDKNLLKINNGKDTLDVIKM